MLVEKIKQQLVNVAVKSTAGVDYVHSKVLNKAVEGLNVIEIDMNTIEDELMTEVRKHVAPANLLSPAIAADDDGERAVIIPSTVKEFLVPEEIDACIVSGAGIINEFFDGEEDMVKCMLCGDALAVTHGRRDLLVSALKKIMIELDRRTSSTDEYWSSEKVIKSVNEVKDIFELRIEDLEYVNAEDDEAEY